MNWDELIKCYRLGCPSDTAKQKCDRNEFLRDFDRIIFSPAFRRLQGKTQVFPFPETDIIHTRLTHSLEASSVGRSLGTIVGRELGFESCNIGSLVSTACLAHDIGNPPLGHSGEDAIKEFYKSEIGQQVMNGLTEEQRSDFTEFEGNAMGFYMLTHSNPNSTEVSGGLGLTYSTLATFTKYPRPALFQEDESLVSEKKPGLFSCDINTYEKIAIELNIPKKPKGNCWYRHPYSFLTEAADDICYYIIDLEDGYKHGLIEYNEITKYLTSIIDLGPSEVNYSNIKRIISERDKIGYLRAKAIYSLIYQVKDVFISHKDEILNGSFDESLTSKIQCSLILKEINNISIKHIYSYDPVLQTEAAGFQVLQGLLEVFLLALSDNKKKSSKKILSLLPNEYQYNFDNQKYESIMSITAYICGMTDSFAVNRYRTIKGIQLPNF